MGCDIHIIAEVQIDGEWKMNTDKVFPNPYYSPKAHEENVARWKERLEEGEINQEQFDKWSKETFLLDKFRVEPDSSRNYDWFAILADVRNGTGFAGCITGAGFDVIAEPRGVPEDACIDWKANCFDWDADMHSHSYLDVNDFNEFDWNQTTLKTGVIPLNVYKKLKDTGNNPEAWSGSISGGDIITISSDKADLVIEGKKTKLKRKKTYYSKEEIRDVDEWEIYVQYEWPVIYSVWFKRQIEQIVNPLRELSKKYEDARIVFGFDN